MIESPQASQNQLSLEQRAEALAQVIHDAFEPEQLPHQEKLTQITAEMSMRLEQLIAAFEENIQEPMR